MAFPMYCRHSAFQGDGYTLTLLPASIAYLPASIVAAVADPDFLHLTTVKPVY